MGKIYKEKGKIDNRRTKKARIGKCLICGKKFRAVKDYSTSNGSRYQKYCSLKCRRKLGQKINYCLNCGEEIVTYKSTDKKYCNIFCRNVDYRKRQKGSNSHFWKGGKTKTNKVLRTNSEFREWREKVFERDNWTCQICGARSGKKKKVFLEPHHIKKVSEHIELIYVVENGITLCNRCHRKNHSHKF